MPIRSRLVRAAAMVPIMCTDGQTEKLEKWCSASPAGIHRMPPGLGEHTREVLREAGFTGDEIERLIEIKAAGAA